MEQSGKYDYVDCAQMDEITWCATGNYPTIKIQEGILSSGWINLRFKYQTDLGEQRDPILSFEMYGIRRRIRLNREQGGQVSHVFKMPEGAIDISIKLIGAKRSFLLSEPKFQEVSWLSAMRSILLGVWYQRSNRSWFLVKRVFSVANQYIKNYGIKALVTRSIAVYREGISRQAIAGKSLAAYEDFQKDWALTDQDIEEMKEQINRFDDLPLISVVMPVFDPEEKWLSLTIDSVIEQIYPNWELCIADDASKKEGVKKLIKERCLSDSRIKVIQREKNGHISAASNSSLGLATGEWVAFLDHDDLLHPAALFCVVQCLQENSQLEFIYTDEDKIGSDGKRYQPHFKPDYNQSLLTSQNYFNHLSIIKRTLVEEVKGFRLGYEGAQDYDLFLRCIEKIQPKEIFHIPFPLYSWRASSGSAAKTPQAKNYAEDAGKRALDDHFRRSKEDVLVSRGACPTTYHSERPVPHPSPLVSIIIPTRDGGKYLNNCLSSLHELTAYPNFQVTILNNGSTDDETLEILSCYKAKGLIEVLDNADPFNFSALNNLGVANSQGELVCLLNDDIEVVSEKWLNEMVSQLLSPEVGVVGAKLLYPDSSVQHAGIVTGIGGIAGHGHKHFPSVHDGYFCRLKVVHDVGAVTGACLLTSRKLWDQLGGLDEESLRVAFNDVDYCLRARSLGKRIIWTPYAELIHHESKTRGLDITKEKVERLHEETKVMKERWGEFLLKDPAYNPNLSLDTESFDIADWPRSLPPWRSD